jgi:hypothetical protein
MTPPQKRRTRTSAVIAGAAAGVLLLVLVGIVVSQSRTATETPHYMRTRVLPLREWGFGVSNVRGFFIPVPIKNNVPTVVETRSWDGTGDWQVTRQMLVMKRLPNSVEMSASTMSTAYSSAPPSTRAASKSQKTDFVITARPDLLGTPGVPNITLSRDAFGGTVLTVVQVSGDLHTRKSGFLAVDTCSGVSVQ